MAIKNHWTWEQTVVVFNLYCKIPFNKATSTNPDIIKIANIIGRSPNSVKMKIGNFGSFDPELKARGIVGLSNVSKLDEEVWNEFNNNWDRLAYESESLIAKFLNQPIEPFVQGDTLDIPIGKEREAIIKARVNQSFFRQAVLSSYNLKCCITGLSIPDFLVASHIVLWSVDEKNRINPHNGLCLNSIHDKAYDRGYITVTTDYKILISQNFDEYKHDKAVLDFFIKYNNQKIFLPEKFLPKIEFLEYHMQNVFRK